MSKKQSAESFWALVDVQDPDHCWNWTRSVNTGGYGLVMFGGKRLTAHRVAAWLCGLVASPSAPRCLRGSGFVLHSCDNKRCCNPMHLEIGTYSKNLQDAYTRQRKRPRTGAQHQNAKLTAQQVRWLRRIYVPRVTPYSKLAKKLGVSHFAVYTALKGKTYTCV